MIRTLPQIFRLRTPLLHSASPSTSSQSPFELHNLFVRAFLNSDFTYRAAKNIAISQNLLLPHRCSYKNLDRPPVSIVTPKLEPLSHPKIKKRCRYLPGAHGRLLNSTSLHRAYSYSSMGQNSPNQCRTPITRVLHQSLELQYTSGF